MKKIIQLFLLSGLIAVVLTAPCPAAESFAVLLQKGIFAEETEGNLDAAMRIYEQIAREAQANRAIAAQAQYRLAVCQQKKGNKAEAISTLNDLRKQFPTETELSQKAGDLLIALGQPTLSTPMIRKIPVGAYVVYSVSSDGRFIAFRASGNLNLLVYETATGKTWTALPGTAAKYVESATISSDGRIAYKTGTEQIRIANVDGSDARSVYTNTTEKVSATYMDLDFLSWTSDGRHLVLSGWRGSTNAAVMLLDLEKGALREIKRWNSQDRLHDSRLSFDGRYLAYRVGSAGESRRKIEVLDLNSGAESALVEKEVRDVVGWSATGDKTLFTSSRNGSTDLWAIGVRDGKAVGEAELVKRNVGTIQPFALTREGAFYYGEGKSSEASYWAAANFETGEILTKQQRATDRFSSFQQIPVWSKDGKSLMLGVDAPDKWFLMISRGSGEEKEFPTRDKFVWPIQQLAWAPDGASLLAQCGNASGQHGFHRFDIASGAVDTLLTQEKGRWSCHPRFSPDGKSFYYARRSFFKDAQQKEDWKDEIVRREILSASEKVIYASPEKLQIWWPFEVSADGKRLALVTSDEFKTNDFVTAIKVWNLDGGDAKEVIRFAPRENVTSLSWTPDGKRVVYTKISGKTEVWSTDVASGKSVELKFLLPNIRHLTVHPDGQQLAFRAGAWEGQDLWVMEGFLAQKKGSSLLTELLPLDALTEQNRTLTDKELDFSVKVPSGWTLRGAGRNRAHGDNLIQFNAPNAAGTLLLINYTTFRPGEFPEGAVMSWSNALGKPGSPEELDVWLRKYAERMSEHRINASFPDYKVAPESIVLRDISGHRAVSAMARFANSGATWNDYLTCIHGEKVIALFRLRAPEGKMEAILPAFKEMIETARFP